MENQPNNLAKHVTADVIANSEPACCRVTQSLRDRSMQGDLQSLAERVAIRRGMRYKHSADLCGRPPRQAIIESGLEYIDVALIGPDAQAAKILADDSRLFAAAKTRVLDARDLDKWTPHVRQHLAQADAIRAARVIEEVLRAR